MDAAAGAITIQVRPNADEAARALFPSFIRRRTTIALIAIGVLLVCAIVGGFVWLLRPLGMGSFWPLFVFIGAVAIALMPWRFFIAFRKRLAQQFAQPRDQSMTFSAAGIDSRSAHSSSHFDWEAVTAARSTPTGVTLQIHRSLIYVSRSNFASPEDYERVLSLIADHLSLVRV